MKINVGDRVRVTSFDEEGWADGIYVEEYDPLNKTGTVEKISGKYINIVFDAPNGEDQHMFPSFFYEKELEIIDEVQ